VKHIEIKFIEERAGTTAMAYGRLQRDKRHTTVQFLGENEKDAEAKIRKWFSELHCAGCSNCLDGEATTGEQCVSKYICSCHFETGEEFTYPSKLGTKSGQCLNRKG
jgi:hypothetical protein